MRTHLLWTIAASAVAALITSVPGCASAQPPGLPDLSGLTDVTASHMQTSPRAVGTFGFATPDGFSCSGGASAAHCIGPLPGLAGIPKGSQTGPCDHGYAYADQSGARVQHEMSECGDDTRGFNILNPGEKVSLGSTTCGVLPGSVTACTSGPHRFVLQPSGSVSS